MGEREREREGESAQGTEPRGRGEGFNLETDGLDGKEGGGESKEKLRCGPIL